MPADVVFLGTIQGRRVWAEVQETDPEERAAAIRDFVDTFILAFNSMFVCVRTGERKT